MAFSIISVLILYLAHVYSKHFGFNKIQSYVGLDFLFFFFGLHKIHSHSSFCFSPFFHLAYFYFPCLPSHIAYAFSNFQACYSSLCSGFPVLPMQFPLSTLSWEYGQGQSLIIQAYFKCFQLSVKVERWNQESLSGCYFNQAT